MKRIDLMEVLRKLITAFKRNKQSSFEIFQIRVNSVNPGMVMTRMALQELSAKGAQEAVRTRTPLQRIAGIYELHR